jgi:hypothetical protein
MREAQAPFAFESREKRIAALKRLQERGICGMRQGPVPAAVQEAELFRQLWRETRIVPACQCNGTMRARIFSKVIEHESCGAGTGRDAHDLADTIGRDHVDEPADRVAGVISNELLANGARTGSVSEASEDPRQRLRGVIRNDRAPAGEVRDVLEKRRFVEIVARSAHSHSVGAARTPPLDDIVQDPGRSGEHSDTGNAGQVACGQCDGRLCRPQRSNPVNAVRQQSSTAAPFPHRSRVVAGLVSDRQILRPCEARLQHLQSGEAALRRIDRELRAQRREYGTTRNAHAQRSNTQEPSNVTFTLVDERRQAAVRRGRAEKHIAKISSVGIGFTIGARAAGGEYPPVQRRDLRDVRLSERPNADGLRVRGRRVPRSRRPARQSR